MAELNSLSNDINSVVISGVSNLPFFGSVLIKFLANLDESMDFAIQF